MLHSCHLLLDHIQFTLIHVPNIPGSYTILFFTVSDFHHQVHPQLRAVSALAQVPFSLELIAISNMLFSSSILDNFWPGRLIFQCHIFWLSYCSWDSRGKNTGVLFPTAPSSGLHFVRMLHYDPSVLNDLHSMAYSFIELCKPLCYNEAVIHEGDILVDVY